MTLRQQDIIGSTTSEGAAHVFPGSQPVTLPELTVTYTYTLKVINPKRKSQFRVEKFRKGGAFKTPMELRLYIIENYEKLLPATTDFDIGYFKPCRGSTKVYIKSDADLDTMYESYKDQQELNIWCIGDNQDDEESANTSANKKRKCDKDIQPSRRRCVREEVDEIFMELKEKYESKYTAQQLRLWANMLQVGTWKDRENPPQNPMFGYNGKTHAKTPSLTEALTSVAEGIARVLRPPVPTGNQSPPTSSRAQLNEMGVSPSKCATLRSQYIEQLKQLHQLLELTAISKDEYVQQKADILKKMQQL